ncbi:helix-turn-helix domain-containing protein, partial [Candidatus Kaiserbacteria bacterium]|nr:helix-turn-helix domain-containing protein [Candidatus Kaiserbacteria bacterium]
MLAITIMSDGVFLNNIKYFSCKEAGDFSGYTHDYVSRLCRDGKVPGKKIGRVWFIEAESFQEFLNVQEDRKNDICKDLSKERKQAYQSILAEKEIEEITRFGIPEITFPKHLAREIFAVVISVTLVFGTYLVKDSSYIHSAFKTANFYITTHVASVYENINNFKNGVREGVDTSSQKMIASVFKITSEDSRNNEKNPLKEIFTYENIYRETANVILSVDQIIDNGLSSYISIINGTGDTVAALVYRDIDLEKQFTIQNFKTKIANNLATINIPSIPDFFGRVIENIRLKAVAWLEFGANEVAVTYEDGSDTERTVINQPVIERIIETKEILVKGGITEEQVTEKLEQLNNKLASAIYNVTSVNTPHSIANNYNVIAQTNNIDKLGNATLNNTTVTGTFSGLTDAHIPDGITASNYMLLSGGTFTDAVVLSSATTTASNGIDIAAGCFAINGTCVGGAGASSAFAWTPTSYGNSTSTTIGFTNGFISTASSTLSATLYGLDSIFSSYVDASYFVATSSTATSTLAGGLAIETSGFVYDYSTNNV